MLALLALALSSALPSVDDGWPETVSSPASQDAAVVVGIEKYVFVPHVPFAARDAYAFWSFLVFDRGVPVERVSLLKEDPAKEEIEEAVRKRAAQVGPGGTLWFYFAGHGAPDPSGQDGLLVGVDAKETPESVAARSVTRGWLVRQLNASRARHVVVVLDACFSGRGRAGGEIARGLRPLLPLVALAGLTRGVILTGAASDQMSGPFDRARHGLFTYFLLGGLRGWGQKDSGGVTLEAAYKYARTAMDVVLSSGGREQTPGIEGPAAAKAIALVHGLGEKGPPLPSLVAEAGEAPPPAEAVAAPPPILIDGRYTLPGGGVVRDTVTGLTWQRATAPEELDWSDAKSYCKALLLAGGGWRLPSKDELLSLLQGRGRTIDTVAFPDTPYAWFWTSSPVAGDPSFAWNVAFNNGDTNYNDVSSTNQVRCVR